MNTYEYQRFMKIAVDNGIAKSTVRSRLKNGMSMEEAVTRPIQKGRVATGVKTVCGIKLTEAQTNQVRINEVGHDTLRRRVKNGMSLDEAISAPVIRRTHDVKQAGDPETLDHIGRIKYMNETCHKNDPIVIPAAMKRYVEQKNIRIENIKAVEC